ncbi:threonine/serine dehydratase [Phytohabitans flavus]
MQLISLDDVRAAAGNVAGITLRTPLLSARWDEELWLKPESLQPVGSFKLRGATNAVAQLSAEQRVRGVITHSSGNHGQALAYAARRAGAPCVVVIPDVAPAVKVEQVRALGAEVVLVPPPERLDVAQERAEKDGLALIPPYDHRDVIAGQGTIGLEIAEDMPDVDVVLVPVGGGGLASGVSTAITALLPRAKVIGVEPELAADAQESLAKGELVAWPTELNYRTAADGVRVNLSELTFAHLRERLDRIVTVTEDEILAAMTRIVRESRLVVEPTGAVTAAARLFHAGELPPGRTVAVVSGGNVDPRLLIAALS